MLKNPPLPRGEYHPPMGEYCPHIYKIYDYFPNAIINIFFNYYFKMAVLKYSALGTIARNFDLYRCVKTIENFKQQQNLLSDMH